MILKYLSVRRLRVFRQVGASRNSCETKHADGRFDSYRRFKSKSSPDCLSSRAAQPCSHAPMQHGRLGMRLALAYGRWNFGPCFEGRTESQVPASPAPHPSALPVLMRTSPPGNRIGRFQVRTTGTFLARPVTPGNRWDIHANGPAIGHDTPYESCERKAFDSARSVEPFLGLVIDSWCLVSRRGGRCGTRLLSMSRRRWIVPKLRWCSWRHRVHG